MKPHPVFKLFYWQALMCNAIYILGTIINIRRTEGTPTDKCWQYIQIWEDKYYEIWLPFSKLVSLKDLKK